MPDRPASAKRVIQAVASCASELAGGGVAGRVRGGQFDVQPGPRAVGRDDLQPQIQVGIQLAVGRRRGVGDQVLLARPGPPAAG